MPLGNSSPSATSSKISPALRTMTRLRVNAANFNA
jgi:hypothetical protein